MVEESVFVRRQYDSITFETITYGAIEGTRPDCLARLANAHVVNCVPWSGWMIVPAGGLPLRMAVPTALTTSVAVWMASIDQLGRATGMIDGLETVTSVSTSTAMEMTGCAASGEGSEVGAARVSEPVCTASDCAELTRTVAATLSGRDEMAEPVLIPVGRGLRGESQRRA